MSDSVEASESQRYNILFLTTDQTYAHAPRPEGYELPNRQRLEDAGCLVLQKDPRRVAFG